MDLFGGELNCVSQHSSPRPPDCHTDDARAGATPRPDGPRDTTAPICLPQFESPRSQARDLLVCVVTCVFVFFIFMF